MVIRGGSPAELYLGAIDGMNKFLQPNITTGGDIKTHEFRIESVDDAALLVDFLSHMLTITFIDKRSYLLKEINFGPGPSAAGSVHGLPINGMKNEIKAVTYHEAYCRKLKTGMWEAGVIFDI